MILLTALVVPAATAERPQHLAQATSIVVEASPLEGFEARDLARRQFGPLRFRGGLVLKSSHRDFGGISSIRMEADGQRFLAVTDRGNWLRGRLRYANGAPVGIEDAELAPVLGPDGQPVRRRRWYDSESLALHDGVAYVGFERVHRILRFDYRRHGLRARGRPIAVPPEFSQLPANRGIEGLVVPARGMPLAGTLIALSERGLDEQGHIRGFLIDRGNFARFAVKRIGDFDITDAAVAPRGDLLILERSFSILNGAGMRIRRAPLTAIRPGAVIEGEVLAEADAGFQIDNMEGLAVHRGPAGETVLTIVSDDNFSRLQRTLLLQFTLVE
ncbi:MAG: esterase-like activity of phytase family protein [Variibacter sp.]|nr:esterase-like activity of phytase family protein [Variibacter sp.]